MAPISPLLWNYVRASHRARLRLLRAGKITLNEARMVRKIDMAALRRRRS